MFRKDKLSYAVATAISASLTVGNVHAALEEIVVTARKQTESLQDVALSVQAIGSEELTQKGITSFDDYIKFLPSVNFGGRGPGQNEVYIRGAAIPGLVTAAAESQGSAPNVAIYLDEQPVTAGGRNLDVYVSDMERIEVLPGPQGTLYGASSQAGTVRLITNKPVLDTFEGNVQASIASTEGGEMSNSTQVTFNFPLIENKLAARVHVFNDRQGGYIDNPNATFTPSSANNARLPNDAGVTFDSGTVFADGTAADPTRTYEVRHQEINNDEVAGDNINDALYSGFRLGVKWAINDDWFVTVQHHRQILETEGVFDYDPELGEFQVSRFSNERLDDEFGQTSLTIEGRLGLLDIVYAGGFLKREVDQIIDYTHYSEAGAYVAGYICEYNTGGHGSPFTDTVSTFEPTLIGDPEVIECDTADGYIAISNENERWTQELRISTDQDNRLRFTGGVFYEDNEIRHVGDFAYGDPTWDRIDPTLATVAIDRDLRPSNVQFTNDITRPEEQLAVFGEFSFDILDSLSFALGARYYELEVGFEGFSAGRFTLRPAPNLASIPGVDITPEFTTIDDDGELTSGARDRDHVRNIAALGKDNPAKTDDTLFKATLTWDINEDILTYLSWSEGFRPAGFNRATASGAGAGIGASALVGYQIPLVYKSDELASYELGWKTFLFDNSLRFNGAIYFIEWDDMQIGVFDPQNLSLFAIVDNAGDSEIRGIEGDFAWAATDTFTLSGAFSYNDTELVSVNPGFAFALSPEGSELPLTPKIQLSMTGRYEWEAAGNTMHAQLSGKYADSSFNSLLRSQREEQNSYVVFDASVGVTGDTSGWSTELFINNLTNELAELNINNLDSDRRITPNRPRTIGLRFFYRFE